MAKAKDTAATTKRTRHQKVTSIGDSDRSRRKSKNQRRHTKPYRGQGK